MDLSNDIGICGVEGDVLFKLALSRVGTGSHHEIIGPFTAFDEVTGLVIVGSGFRIVGTGIPPCCPCIILLVLAVEIPDLIVVIHDRRASRGECRDRDRANNENGQGE